MKRTEAKLRDVLRLLRRGSGRPEVFTERQRKALVDLATRAACDPCADLAIAGFRAVLAMDRCNDRLSRHDG